MNTCSNHRGIRSFLYNWKLDIPLPHLHNSPPPSFAKKIFHFSPNQEAFHSHIHCTFILHKRLSMYSLQYKGTFSLQGQHTVSYLMCAYWCRKKQRLPFSKFITSVHNKLQLQLKWNIRSMSKRKGNKGYHSCLSPTYPDHFNSSTS